MRTCSNWGLVNEELAKCLSNILFAHKLVIMQPHMVRAIVYQKQMKDPQIVPIVNGCAYVSLFCRNMPFCLKMGKAKDISTVSRTGWIP